VIAIHILRKIVATLSIRHRTVGRHLLLGRCLIHSNRDQRLDHPRFRCWPSIFLIVASDFHPKPHFNLMTKYAGDTYLMTWSRNIVTLIDNQAWLRETISEFIRTKQKRW